jgi:hypothetical protein
MFWLRLSAFAAILARTVLTGSSAMAIAVSFERAPVASF